jgi:signal transduction histidine kinase/AmiR/NasT family two-component response regulator
MKKKKILVVDDDRVILTFAAKLLAREGHEVVTAGDGFEALNALAGFTPDIIFFDLIMPKIDGDKLIAIVRSMPKLQHCFLVIVSAAVAEVDFSFQDTGADYYIAKGPFSAMSESFAAAIQASEGAEPAVALKPVVGLEHVYARQLTKELLSRNRHLETILESMAEGILEVYADKVVYANSAAIALLRIPLERMLTAYPPDLFEGDVRERVAEAFRAGPGQPAEMGLTQPLEMNGRQVVVKKLPVKGDATTVILMITDITERKRLEMQLQHAQKLEAIGTIAAGVAHNFRNTLTEVLVNSQLIQLNFKEQPNIQEITERISSSVKKGSRLVDGLLHFSRKQISREFRTLELADVIRETCRIVRESFAANVELELDIQDRLPVEGDSSALSQVIMNLCTNARDAMPQGGLLRIEARRAGDNALVVVSDAGTGMEREVLEKCFDPFFTTKPVDKGTGLGLSTAYGIIKSHEGVISVDSAPGAGTTFRLQFPLARSDAGSVSEGAKALAYGDGQSILMVDDEVDILRAMAGLLKTLNYRPLFTAKGAEAVELFRSSRPDLVLLDLNMPGMDGIECARQMLDIDPKARIVIFSGYDPSQQKLPDLLEQKLLKGYLTKPADLSELSRFLSGILNEAPPAV